MPHPPTQHLRKFRFNMPQRIAALLLLLFMAQCLFVIRAAPSTAQDYHYAACGSRLWTAFSPSTPAPADCRTLHGGVLAYRAAGLPLAIDHWSASLPASAAPPDIASSLSNLLFWIRLPFLLAGLALGGCLWWVTRRLFGNPGGYIALGFYCFAPPVIAHSTVPNNGILAAFGLFAALYTAIGVAHALQGPRRKWRKRIILLAVTLGFTAAASVLAFLLALIIGTGLLLWLAEDRRKYVPPLTLLWTTGALLIFFAANAFNPSAFNDFLHFVPAAQAAPALPNLSLHWLSFHWPTAILCLALVLALAAYAALHRARYFGNTTPLWIAALLLLLAATHVHAACWLWAVPFLLTFLGGVYADLLETRSRRGFLSITIALILAQAAFCLAALPRLIQ